MTEAEMFIWSHLRRKQLKGYQFYRQKIIGNYIVDFYCPAAKLIIELENLGLEVLRFSDSDVFKNKSGVMERIYESLKSPSNPPFSKGEVQNIVKRLDLKPHPEGGFYRETYRSAGKFGDKNHSTAIYFLLTPGNFSALHRIRSDEAWHFYSGGSITIVEITPKGDVKRTVIGNDFEKGEVPQYVVPAGNWFGSYLNEGGEYALVGCTVSPGFEFTDFEMGKRAELLEKYPRASEEIVQLTRVG